MPTSRTTTYFFFFLLTAALSLFECFYDLGQVSIRYSDEATHARVMQEMQLSGDFFHPTLDGQPYWNKPPLKMWLGNQVVRLLGQSNFGYRFLDGLCAFLTLLMTFWLGARMFSSPLAGFSAVAILLSRPGFIEAGRFNQTTQDSMVVALSCAALLLGWRTCERLAKGIYARTSWLGIGALSGAGVLVKTVVGIFPLIILPWPLLATGKLPELVKRRWAWLVASGLLMAAVIGFFYGTVLHEDPTRWARIFGYDIQQRLLTQGFHHADAPWFYWSELFGRGRLLCVWILVLAILWTLLAYRRRPLASIFLLVWAFVPLVAFSLLKSRALHYLGPAFPAFGLMAGGMVADIWNRRLVFGKLATAVLLTGVAGQVLYDGAKTFSGTLAAKRKLPIELFAQDMSQKLKIAPTAPLILYKIDPRLSAEPYQSWRYRFYLHPFLKNTQIAAEASQLDEVLRHNDNVVVLTSRAEAEVLLRSSNFCAQMPIPIPETARQSPRPNAENPALVALFKGRCELVQNGIGIPRLLAADSPDFDSLIGFSSPQGFAGFEVRKLLKSANSFQFTLDPITAGDTRRIIFAMGLRTKLPSPPSEVYQLSLQGVQLGTITIDKKKLLSREVCIPEGVLQTGANVLTLRAENSALLSRAAVMRAISFSNLPCSETHQ